MSWFQRFNKESPRQALWSWLTRAGTVDPGSTSPPIDAVVNFEGDASDLDSGAGTDNHAVVGVAFPASGGHAVASGVAAGDAVANPTTLQVIAHLMGLEGANWRRLAALTPTDSDASGTALVVAGRQALYAGAGINSWHRARGNERVDLLTSAARTATVNSSDVVNYNGRGAHVVVDVTSITGSPSITVKVQGKDTLSGKYYDVLVSSAITTTGTTVLKIYPGIAALANAAASDILPYTFRVRVEHANGDSITYSVGTVVNV